MTQDEMDEKARDLGHKCASDLIEFLESLKLDKFTYATMLHGIIEISTTMSDSASSFASLASLLRAAYPDVGEADKHLAVLRKHIVSLLDHALDTAFAPLPPEKDIATFVAKVASTAHRLASKNGMSLKEAFAAALNECAKTPAEKKIREQVKDKIEDLVGKVESAAKEKSEDKADHPLVEPVVNRAKEIHRKEGLSKQMATVKAIRELVKDPKLQKQLLGDLYMTTLMGSHITQEISNE